MTGWAVSLDRARPTTLVVNERPPVESPPWLNDVHWTASATTVGIRASVDALTSEKAQQLALAHLWLHQPDTGDVARQVAMYEADANIGHEPPGDVREPRQPRPDWPPATAARDSPDNRSDRIEGAVATPGQRIPCGGVRYRNTDTHHGHAHPSEPRDAHVTDPAFGRAVVSRLTADAASTITPFSGRRGIKPYLHDSRMTAARARRSHPPAGGRSPVPPAARTRPL
jgi:hypothetical protein